MYGSHLARTRPPRLPAREDLHCFGGFAPRGPNITSAKREPVPGLRNSRYKRFATAVCIGTSMLIGGSICFNATIRPARLRLPGRSRTGARPTIWRWTYLGYTVWPWDKFRVDHTFNRMFTATKRLLLGNGVERSTQNFFTAFVPLTGAPRSGSQAPLF